MLINEVEHLVGISKKSIRYYEQNGLLSPTRNRDNDYRKFTSEDIQKLKMIKFLRELNVPVREIKLLANNKLTLKDCMIDRLEKIKREEEKYLKVKNICSEILNSNEIYDSIDISSYLQEINILHKEGFTMKELPKNNKKKKIVSAVTSSLVFSAFFLFIGGIITYFQITEAEKMPWILFIFIMFIFIIPVIGIIYNLIIRIKEIMKGEEDEASKY